MVRVLYFRKFRFTVYQEKGGKHHKPHCHVEWPDGECSVDLENLQVLDGDRLPKAAERYLRDHKDELVAVWQLLNGRS